MLFFKRARSYEGVLGKWRYSYTHSLNSTLDGGELPASRPGRFTPRERAAGTIGYEAEWAPDIFLNGAVVVRFAL